MPCTSKMLPMESHPRQISADRFSEGFTPENAAFLLGVRTKGFCVWLVPNYDGFESSCPRRQHGERPNCSSHIVLTGNVFRLCRGGLNDFNIDFSTGVKRLHPPCFCHVSSRLQTKIWWISALSYLCLWHRTGELLCASRQLP